MEGSFRDLHVNTSAAGGGGRNGARATGGGGSPLANYSTFSSDQSVQALLRTSDKIEQTKRTMHESEEVARNVLVDLELQRSQMHDVKGMVQETTSVTGDVRLLLQKIADRAYRRKVFLWLIIILLAITDITVFYLLFLRSR